MIKRIKYIELQELSIKAVNRINLFLLLLLLSSFYMRHSYIYEYEKIKMSEKEVIYFFLYSIFYYLEIYL